MNLATELARAPIFAAEQPSRPQSVAAPPLSPREQARRYCILILLLPMLAIPAFIRLGCSDFFMRHGASVWVQSNDAVFGMRDRDCDVLIFGDSTAMTGINPEVVERNTGFKTCNIAVTNSVLAVTHNLTLNRYLANNAPPRVLLIQLSPDGFQPESSSWRQTVYPEGMLELLRHGTSAEARRVLVTHPQESIAFAGYAAGFSAYYMFKDLWFHTTRLRPEEDTVIIHNGFFTPPAPASTACEPSAAPSKAGGSFPRSLVSEFQDQYSDRSGMVLVNVAPIPSCDANLAAFRTELDGVTSNSLTPLPIGLFNDPVARHYTAVGSAVVSKLVSQELNELANRNPSIDDRMPGPGTIATLSRAHLTIAR
jgi:hypothetical protein